MLTVRRYRPGPPQLSRPGFSTCRITPAETLLRAELELEVARVERYREIVRHAASGWTLSRVDSDAVSVLLLQLELPAGSFPRDVAAVRAFWDADTEHKKRELAWIYAHLFSPPDRWAELRRADRGNRRRALDEIRQAIAAGE